MQLTTLANVKALLGIGTTTDDALITQLVTRFSVLIEQRLNRVMDQGSVTETRDGDGSPILWLRRPPVSAITSVHISAEQVWDATTLIAATDYLFDSSGRLYLRSGGVFPWAFQAVRVVYTGGFATVPADVEHYATRKVAEFFQQRTTLGISSMALKDGSVSYRAAAAKDVLTDLDDEIGHRVLRRAGG